MILGGGEVAGAGSRGLVLDLKAWYVLCNTSTLSQGDLISSDNLFEKSCRIRSRDDEQGATMPVAAVVKRHKQSSSRPGLTAA